MIATTIKTIPARPRRDKFMAHYLREDFESSGGYSQSYFWVKENQPSC
jgi:hypothetical protein